MVIGIDASRANRDKKTGVEWYSYCLIQELKKIIPENIGVILYTDKPLNGELAKLPPNWQEKILKWPFNYFWTQGRLSLEILFNPPDILFIPSSAIPFICPKIVFTTIHDVGFKKLPRCYSLLERIYLDWSTKFAIKKCVKIFVPSEFTKKELINYFKVDENKVVVAPLAPVNVPTIGDDTKLDFEKFDFNSEFILFIGRPTPKKNILRIIEAFKLFKRENPDSKFKLVLVGCERGKIVGASEETSDILKLDWLSPKEVSFLLEKAKAFIFPSLYEGFGLPILEAFAARVPVITSRGIATEEITRLRSNSVEASAGQAPKDKLNFHTGQAQYAALLVNPLSVIEIKEAIFKVVSDENLRQDLIEKGKERLKDFSWQKTTKITWEQMWNCRRYDK